MYNGHPEGDEADIKFEKTVQMLIIFYENYNSTNLRISTQPKPKKW